MKDNDASNSQIEYVKKLRKEKKQTEDAYQELVGTAQQIEKDLIQVYSSLSDQDKATHDAVNMVFDQFDTNDDGHLNIEEIKAYFAQTTEKTPDEKEI